MSRTLARNEAYDRLRSWIIEGTLHPNEVLRDQDIAAALGVSRTPVREALRRLEDEGFVETALNRWTRVAGLDVTKAVESYAVIEALEVLALEQSFPRLTEDDLERLNAANLAMQKGADDNDPVAAVRGDEQFHDVWISRCENGELQALVAQQKAKLRRVELAYFDAAAPARQSFREHAAIIRALHKVSLAEAQEALHRNWQGSAERLRALVQAKS
jgi:DNA-binding GntR family transcriptional regulator